MGQEDEFPVQVSTGSHDPVLARQTVVLEEYWHVELQQSSLDGSHTEAVVYLQVAASQHALPLHPDSPPQSQSSPVSTMPLPHWLPVMVTTFLLLVKQLESTDWRPKAEQMLPMEHEENCSMPSPVDGFIMNWPFALQVDALSGQHCCFVAVPSPHVVAVQSCTAPKV